jgi:hypothetical protein
MTATTSEGLPRDRRFADPAWSENPFLRRAHLDWRDDRVGAVAGGEPGRSSKEAETKTARVQFAHANTFHPPSRSSACTPSS